MKCNRPKDKHATAPAQLGLDRFETNGKQPFSVRPAPPTSSETPRQQPVPAWRCLPRSFFNAPVDTVAPRLLGHWLIARDGETFCGGRIVEVEAYHQDDPASHSHPGPTERNRAMFGPPGHAYVYLSYGVHHCVNVVCREAGIGEAVLFRALAPEFGIATMQRRRGQNAIPQIANGPGKICQALAIDRRHDHVDLCRAESPLFIARAPDAETFAQRFGGVARSPRIGITKAADAPLRFFLPASPFLSRRPSTR